MTLMERLISLGSAGASDASAVGAKAARLSRAKIAGMPVLPGWVLPAPASVAAIRVGTEDPGSDGRMAALRAASALQVDEATARDLAGVSHRSGRTSVVRSTTPLDDDGRWAGAFTTYHDVERELLPVAVRGCWASAFSPDVRARRRRLGVGHVRVGVLIQPWLSFEFGGTAALVPDGDVELTASAGGPAGVLGGLGWAEGVPPEVEVAAVDLARAVAAELGDQRIEWGWAAGAIWLLQAGSRREVARTQRPSWPAFPMEPRLLGIARMVARCRAPLADAVVVPWALACEELPSPAVIRAPEVERALADASALADGLAADAWGLTPGAAIRAATEVARALLGPQPERGVGALPPIRPVDRAAAARLLGLIAGIGETLAARGVLEHPDLVWRLSPRELRTVAARGRAAPSRGGPDRWEPFVFRAVAAGGRSAAGTSAAPGIGAGPLWVVRGSDPGRMPPPRSIVAARAPVPQLAPMLFGAAGVVTASGSRGAHLFEVARSLGIPAVVGIDLAGADGAVVAVDGDHAQVGVLAEAAEPLTEAFGG